MAKTAIRLAPSRPEAGDAGGQERLWSVEAEFDIRIFSKSRPGTAVRAGCRIPIMGITAKSRVDSASKGESRAINANSPPDIYPGGYLSLRTIVGYPFFFLPHIDITMFYDGDLRSGITTAIEESKLVACFVRGDSCPILSVEAKANDDIQMKLKKAHYGKMTF